MTSVNTGSWAGGHHLTKQQQSAKRANNAKLAKNFINQVVPKVLQSNKRARLGIEASHLIVNPPPQEQPADAQDEAQEQGEQQPMQISVKVADTLQVARELGKGKGGKVAILNMASPLRPGGGVLSGATSQEESLCSRTTLYPALQEEFYRLPEVGGVYTPDVLILRDSDTASQAQLPAKDRFYVDVVSASMLRFPSLKEVNDGEDQRQEYEVEADRALVLDKMRAVMRMLQTNGVDRAVLGAWGCGAYGNPVQEVARAWRKVLLGNMGKGRHHRKPKDSWPCMEIVFAIKSSPMARQFAAAWGPDIDVEEPAPTGFVCPEVFNPDSDEDRES